MMVCCSSGVDWGVGEEEIDDYDARDRPWYLQASHSPKDIVIVVDTSGSMTGSREFVANHAIKQIIETLLDDDFFNILTVKKDFLESPMLLLPVAFVAVCRRDQILGRVLHRAFSTG